MTFTGSLKPYQVPAVDLMVERQNALVAYDLGLGKTVLTIAAIEELRSEGLVEWSPLIVCGSSLKYQWADSIHEFTDKNVFVLDGGPDARAKDWEDFAAMQGDPDWYFIVNYEQIVNDWDQISRLNFGAVALDEVTAISGYTAKRAITTKDLVREIPNRFGLTATPIENGKPEQLFSMMQAIDYRVLGSRWDHFDQRYIVRDHFGGVKHYQNLDVLHEKIKVAMVRKKQTDPDVAPYLPKPIDLDPIVVPFDRWTAQVYRHIANDLLTELAEAKKARGGGSWTIESHYGEEEAPFDREELTARGRVMSRATALRMLCDSPQLVINSADKWDPMRRKEGSKYLWELLQDEPQIRQWLESARNLKLERLQRRVAEHLDANKRNKIVLFTSYVDMVKEIHDALGGVMFTGAMTAKKKHAQKIKFQIDPDTRVFISSDAGGYGVDLPQANALINYDLPWIPGLAIQRNGRIKRVSSKWKEIYIQDMLMQDSVEVRQHEILRVKQTVPDAVIDGLGVENDGHLDMTVEALSRFLREVMP